MSANEIFNQGITELNCGNSKKALTLFNRVLELIPNHVDSLIKKRKHSWQVWKIC